MRSIATIVRYAAPLAVVVLAGCATDPVPDNYETAELVATMEIVTMPPGALVYLNAEYLGTSPVTVRQVGAGQHHPRGRPAQHCCLCRGHLSARLPRALPRAAARAGVHALVFGNAGAGAGAAGDSVDQTPAISTSRS